MVSSPLADAHDGFRHSCSRFASSLRLRGGGLASGHELRKKCVSDKRAVTYVTEFVARSRGPIMRARGLRFVSPLFLSAVPGAAAPPPAVGTSPHCHCYPGTETHDVPGRH